MKIHEEIKCNNCGVVFEIIYNHRDGLPSCCPFCSSEGDLGVGKEINNDNKLNYPPGVR